jgi:hypothetical protein
LQILEIARQVTAENNIPSETNSEGTKREKGRKRESNLAFCYLRNY